MDVAQPTSTRTSNPLLILISAPSGAGKTTVCQQLLSARPGLTRAITCTTRLPRGGEVHGVDYHFFAEAEFTRRVQAGEFLEHAVVYGNHYGTMKAEVLNRLAAGRDVLLNVDVQGAAAIREQAQNDTALREALVSIFLTPPSLAVLEQRLRRRATDDEAVIARRLAVAREELSHWRDYDYLLISSTIPEDLRRMLLIVEAETMRSRRVKTLEL